MILGAVLAGGQSSRFGSDKADAELRGLTLLERAIESLKAMCASVIVVGREHASAPSVPDWPRAGMGPLGGIAGALRHADEQGFSGVLTCGVDSVALPKDLRECLDPAPAFVASQPVIGHWPTDTLPTIESILQGDGRHSVIAFAKAIGARDVQLAVKPDNINTPADLAAAETRHDL
ncbi:molybdenum cofactor guanylyltransferase [uncultured Erythrobacter sp.]|uniref:molybdenum cofactor guanylyltransferase n=1 Tax=uncultured Erythrobacter sp. TaxID=263913 RepID=UPI002605BEE7|nr:molybdenum cofactor guanylyltransferase [uncultured Erythrobacter sp.]